MIQQSISISNSSTMYYINNCLICITNTLSIISLYKEIVELSNNTTTNTNNNVSGTLVYREIINITITITFNTTIMNITFHVEVTKVLPNENISSIPLNNLNKEIQDVAKKHNHIENDLVYIDNNSYYTFYYLLSDDGYYNRIDVQRN